MSLSPGRVEAFLFPNFFISADVQLYGNNVEQQRDEKDRTDTYCDYITAADD
jgi:hypothetical protein